jgi:acyl dehydratase
MACSSPLSPSIQIRNSLRRRAFRVRSCTARALTASRANAIVDNVLDRRCESGAVYGARFAGVVFPGETLRANNWTEDGRFVVLSGVELISV